MAPQQLFQILLQSKPLVSYGRRIVGDEFHKEVNVALAAVEITSGRGSKEVQPSDAVLATDGRYGFEVLLDQRYHREQYITRAKKNPSVLRPGAHLTVILISSYF